MATIDTKSTVDEILDKVRELEPLIREHADDAERNRRLSAPVSAALRDAGLFRLFRPEPLGGFGLDPVSVFRVIEAVARIDSATGWNVGISNASEPFGASLPASAAEDIVGNPNNVLAGAFNPPRVATPVEGGYRVNGQTSFNSNCHAANWIIGLANIHDPDGLRTDEHGIPITIITFVPKSDITIVENWNTLGMCGTGSHDVKMDDVFVRDDYTAVLGPNHNPASAYDGPLHRMNPWHAIACNAVPSLGIAQAAIDDLISMGLKVPAYAQYSLRDRNSVQLNLARAQAKVSAARILLHTTFDEMWQKALSGNYLEMADRSRCQMAASYLVVTCAEAVDLVHACVGASGIRNEQKFQKYFRDVHVVTQHAYVCESRLESVGQVMLGLEPEWPFFHI